MVHADPRGILQFFIQSLSKPPTHPGVGQVLKQMNKNRLNRYKQVLILFRLVGVELVIFFAFLLTKPRYREESGDPSAFPVPVATALDRYASNGSDLRFVY